MFNIMDKLESLNIHIDEQERLRIVSDQERDSSQAISLKSQQILSSLHETIDDLSQTIELLDSLEEQNKRLKPLKLATIIEKLDGSRNKRESANSNIVDTNSASCLIKVQNGSRDL